MQDGEQVLGSVERVFRLWLELSSEAEIRALVRLVQEEFRRRGYSLSYMVERRNVEGR